MKGPPTAARYICVKPERGMAKTYWVGAKSDAKPRSQDSYTAHCTGTLKGAVCDLTSQSSAWRTWDNVHSCTGFFCWTSERVPHILPALGKAAAFSLWSELRKTPKHVPLTWMGLKHVLQWCPEWGGFPGSGPESPVACLCPKIIIIVVICLKEVGLLV